MKGVRASLRCRWQVISSDPLKKTEWLIKSRDRDTKERQLDSQPLLNYESPMLIERSHSGKLASPSTDYLSKTTPPTQVNKTHFCTQYFQSITFVFTEVNALNFFIFKMLK